MPLNCQSAARGLSGANDCFVTSCGPIWCMLTTAGTLAVWPTKIMRRPLGYPHVVDASTHTKDHRKGFRDVCLGHSQLDSTTVSSARATYLFIYYSASADRMKRDNQLQMTLDLLYKHNGMTCCQM